MEGKQDNRVMLGMFKPIERIPEWAKCCPPAVEHLQLYCGKIFHLDMGRVSKTTRTTCRGCGSTTHAHPFAVLVKPSDGFNAMLLEFVDLEGD